MRNVHAIGIGTSAVVAFGATVAVGVAVTDPSGFAALTGIGATVDWLVDICFGEGSPGAMSPDMDMSDAAGHGQHYGQWAGAATALGSVGILMLRRERRRAARARQRHVLSALLQAAHSADGAGEAEVQAAYRAATGETLPRARLAEVGWAMRQMPLAATLETLAREVRPEDRDVVLKAVIGLAWSTGGFTGAGLRFLGLLANLFDRSGDELELLFDSVVGGTPSAQITADLRRRTRPAKGAPRRPRPASRDHRPSLAGA